MDGIELDARLGAIAARVKGCSHVADIGADHGRLACYLLENNPSMQMTVSDVSAPSLEKAKKLLTFRGQANRVRFCVADGLDSLQREADAIVIAGMGAKTIREILTQGRERIGNARLLLQPNLDIPQLRRFLFEAGFDIDDEQALHAAGRHYLLLEARLVTAPRAGGLTPREAFLGVKLPERRDADTRLYYAWQKAVRERECGQIQAVDKKSPAAAARMAALQSELVWLEEVL